MGLVKEMEMEMEMSGFENGCVRWKKGQKMRIGGIGMKWKQDDIESKLVLLAAGCFKIEKK